MEYFGSCLMNETVTDIHEGKKMKVFSCKLTITTENI